MAVRSSEFILKSLSTSTTTLQPPSPTLSPKEIMRNNFYKTYDAMTGVRIAATLGGFFALMVILVVYKSKSKTEKALEDPKLAAAAVAEVEEEERQLAAALEATAFEELNPNSSRRTRRSLDTPSISSGWIRSTTRFSSVGGYSNLMEPPMRTHSRLPCFIDEDTLPEEDRFSCEDLSMFYNRYLDVPRRSSNITCSSSDSSYLERRGSSVVLGIPAMPAHPSSRNRRRQSSPLPEQYDFYFPIDIRVIQPTPSGSPCGSERAIYENVRLAPLASISSCNSSLATDYPDIELQSFNSDSVFHDYDNDTEDEIEPFSSDSEQEATFIGTRDNILHDNQGLPMVDRASPSVQQQQLPEGALWSQETLF